MTGGEKSGKRNSESEKRKKISECGLGIWEIRIGEIRKAKFEWRKENFTAETRRGLRGLAVEALVMEADFEAEGFPP